MPCLLLGEQGGSLACFGKPSIRTIDTIHCVEQKEAPFIELLKQEHRMNNPETSNEIQMDAANLYVEEVFTDNAVGTLRRLSPVTPGGDPDATRSAQYIGATQVMTTAGPLPLSFEIEGDSLAEAAANFGGAAKAAFEKTMEELKEMQRQQASSIVVPGAGAGPMGGGNIQMP
jgi:hypothetical protein